MRANDEHIDFKDLRLMFQTFRKQNLNFVKYARISKILNPLYAEMEPALCLGMKLLLTTIHMEQLKL